MDIDAPAESLLLALPDACLLAVLQCFATDDLLSLFSAAQAHSRLHQAALLALSSIKAAVNQQQADNVIMYLDKHGQYVDIIHLSGRSGDVVHLPQLPPGLEVSTLKLGNLHLQLHPDGFVMGAGVLAALKQLYLGHCTLEGDVGAAAVTAALLQLPAGLECLGLGDVRAPGGEQLQFPTVVFEQLPQLTYLMLFGIAVQGPDQDQPALQPLQALTRLVELRLDLQGGGDSVSASMLAGSRNLTCLELFRCIVEPGALTGKTLLQRLHLHAVEVEGGAAGEARLLSRLLDLQQLTQVNVAHSLKTAQRNSPPATAYAALTASSRLQALNISNSILPAGVWQHMFPAGRQLPHLTSLYISWAKVRSSHDSYPVPAGSLLVSCCPNVEYLSMRGLQFDTMLLAPLQGLDRLHTLQLCVRYGVIGQSVGPVCQLTALRNLQIEAPYGSVDKGRLLQLTKLKQLTSLTYKDSLTPHVRELSLTSEDPSDEPVWRQLLWLHTDCDDLKVAQEADASWAEAEEADASLAQA